MYARDPFPIPVLYYLWLNEQVAYKRWVTGPKKMATGINYCQNGHLVEAKVTLVSWTQALSHSFPGFFLRTLKTVRCIWLLWRHFCISRIQIDEAITSTTCVEAKKEALAGRILQVRQLLTLPGTCLIDNATLLNVMCDALLP